MKAVKIEWDIDMDEVYEILDDMTIEKAAAAINISERKYANMTTAERHDHAYDFFRHCPGALYDFFCLNEEEDIPENVNEEDVADYLSDKYGFCINSLQIAS